MMLRNKINKTDRRFALLADVQVSLVIAVISSSRRINFFVKRYKIKYKPFTKDSVRIKPALKISQDLIN